MDIDFNGMTISRLIMHTINEKLSHQHHAQAVHDGELLEASQDVVSLLRTRLIDAAGKQSKSFEMEIENDNEGSFFSYCDGLVEKEDEDFLQTSKDIADLLAESQTRTSIPGGYMILLECIYCH